MSRRARRAQVLFAHGASVSVAEELLAYTRPPDLGRVSLPTQVPLPSELAVAAWRSYAAEAAEVGVFQALRQRLIQLQFPIQAGISQSAAYQAATRAGTPPASAGPGLALKHPDALQLRLHQTLAGVVPILVPHGRHDFVALVRAFAKKNEPAPIPDSMGACIIIGYLNWDRIHTLRQAWSATVEQPAMAEILWQQELRARIVPHKPLYHDSLIILSDGEYSGVTASAIGLPTDVWQRDSFQIRLEHECMHYVMRRLLPARPSPIVEELIADLRGMTATWKTFPADRFLRCMGLEPDARYQEGGRLDLYRGEPALSEAALTVLIRLVRAAAFNLERLYNGQSSRWATERGQAQLALALACLTLEELAAPECQRYVEQALEHVELGGSSVPLSLPGSRLA